jgi:hypothetical protein
LNGWNCASEGVFSIRLSIICNSRLNQRKQKWGKWAWFEWARLFQAASALLQRFQAAYANNEYRLKPLQNG